jgi:hypothetical protein
MTVSGLNPTETYFFAVRAKDEANNLGATSNSPGATPLTDTIFPAAITDLRADGGALDGTVALSWTAPGDNDTSGTASSYVVKYSDEEITEANWASATLVASGVPVPQIAGSSELMTVSELTPNDTYYFAVKTLDEVNNTSVISNSPSGLATPDTSAPSTINDLSANSGAIEDTIILSWIAPGEDGNAGTANNYVIRQMQPPLRRESPRPSQPGRLKPCRSPTLLREIPIILPYVHLIWQATRAICPTARARLLRWMLLPRR